MLDTMPKEEIGEEQNLTCNEWDIFRQFNKNKFICVIKY